MLGHVSARGRPLIRSLVSLIVAAALFAGLGASHVVRAQATFAVDEEVVVDTYALNLRGDPTLDAGVITVLLDGTCAIVVDGPVNADGFTWYQLDVDGTLGWSAGEYLALEEGGHGFMPAGTVAVVATDALNLRSAPGLDADVVTVLAGGDLVTVLASPVSADGSDWYRLNAAGTVGWAVRDLLAFAPADPDAIALDATVIVNTDTLNLRAEPTTAGAEATVLDGPVSADGYRWFEVETDTGSGWLAGEYLLVA